MFTVKSGRLTKKRLLFCKEEKEHGICDRYQFLGGGVVLQINNNLAEFYALERVKVYAGVEQIDMIIRKGTGACENTVQVV